MPGYSKAVILKHSLLTGSDRDRCGGVVPVEPAVRDPLGGWVMLANVTWSQVSCSGENTGGAMPRLDQDRSKIQRGTPVELCDSYHLAAVHMATLKHQQSAKRLNRFLRLACRFLQSAHRLSMRPHGSAVNYLRMRTMVPDDARRAIT